VVVSLVASVDAVGLVVRLFLVYEARCRRSSYSAASLKTALAPLRSKPGHARETHIEAAVRQLDGKTPEEIAKITGVYVFQMRAREEHGVVQQGTLPRLPQAFESCAPPALRLERDIEQLLGSARAVKEGACCSQERSTP